MPYKKINGKEVWVDNIPNQTCKFCGKKFYDDHVSDESKNAVCLKCYTDIWFGYDPRTGKEIKNEGK